MNYDMIRNNVDKPFKAWNYSGYGINSNHPETDIYSILNVTYDKKNKKWATAIKTVGEVASYYIDAATMAKFFEDGEYRFIMTEEQFEWIVRIANDTDFLETLPTNYLVLLKNIIGYNTYQTYKIYSYKEQAVLNQIRSRYSKFKIKK